MPQLSVIIVNYNVKYFLEQCLHTVLKACTGISSEIIVVDNNSTDGSEEYFSDRFPTIQFFWNKENSGFAKANAIGLLQASGENILFLNPDTLLAENTIGVALQHLEENKICGALGVQMIDGKGIFLPESKRMMPNPFSALLTLTGLSKKISTSNKINNYRADNLDKDEVHVVEVLSGAFMLVRKNVLEKVGSFDPAFFMYGEDIDLSYRITKGNYENHYLGSTSITHFKGESNDVKDRKYLDRFYGAMEIFVQKYFAFFPGLLYRLAIKCTALFLKMRMAFLNKKTDLPTPFSFIICVCAKEDRENIHLLVTNAVPSAKLQFLTAHRDWATSLAGDFANASHYLFSIDSLGMQSVIDFMKQNNRKQGFLFYSHVSGTIISSTDKNSSGFCWHSHKL